MDPLPNDLDKAQRLLEARLDALRMMTESFNYEQNEHYGHDNGSVKKIKIIVPHFNTNPPAKLLEMYPNLEYIEHLEYQKSPVGDRLIRYTVRQWQRRPLASPFHPMELIQPAESTFASWTSILRPGSCRSGKRLMEDLEADLFRWDRGPEQRNHPGQNTHCKRHILFFDHNGSTFFRKGSGDDLLGLSKKVREANEKAKYLWHSGRSLDPFSNFITTLKVLSESWDKHGGQIFEPLPEDGNKYVLNSRHLQQSEKNYPFANRIWHIVFHKFPVWFTVTSWVRILGHDGRYYWIKEPDAFQRHGGKKHFSYFGIDRLLSTVHKTMFGTRLNNSICMYASDKPTKREYIQADDKDHPDKMRGQPDREREGSAETETDSEDEEELQNRHPAKRPKLFGTGFYGSITLPGTPDCSKTVRANTFMGTPPDGDEGDMPDDERSSKVAERNSRPLSPCPDLDYVWARTASPKLFGRPTGVKNKQKGTSSPESAGMATPAPFPRRTNSVTALEHPPPSPRDACASSDQSSGLLPEHSPRMSGPIQEVYRHSPRMNQMSATPTAPMRSVNRLMTLSVRGPPMQPRKPPLMTPSCVHQQPSQSEMDSPQAASMQRSSSSEEANLNNPFVTRRTPQNETFMAPALLMQHSSPQMGTSTSPFGTHQAPPMQRTISSPAFGSQWPQHPSQMSPAYPSTMSASQVPYPMSSFANPDHMNSFSTPAQYHYSTLPQYASTPPMPLQDYFSQQTHDRPSTPFQPSPTLPQNTSPNLNPPNGHQDMQGLGSFYDDTCNPFSDFQS